MGAEPHSAASSKSWIERSVQQSIITRKCRSQRLRVSCETQQSGRQPLVQVLARQTRTAELMGLTSVSKINRRLSTTTIFLTPLKLSQDVNREMLNNQLSGYSACQNVLQHIYSSTNHIYSSKLYLVMRTVFNMSSITKKVTFKWICTCCKWMKTLPGIKLLLTDWTRRILAWWASIIQWVRTFSLSPFWN